MEIYELLINWYQANKRDLPWRQTTHPYPIWISEIILQQTRVQQGLPYFYRFMERFPAVEDIAYADEQEVLNLWQGLGYYSRARNLHKGTQQIVFDLKGVFPDNYKDWLKIKGVGSYTAAAIASFAFKEPVPVVDGNVFRVLSRILDIETNIAASSAKRYFFDLSEALMDKRRPDLYNQAIMEFGALQCVPKNPDCEQCVLNTRCEAFAKNKVNQLPVKIKARNNTVRYFHYFVMVNDGEVYLKKRTQKDIWQNMYEFPMIETKSEVLEKELLKTFGINREQISLIRRNKKHVLSHQHIYPVFWQINAGKQATLLMQNAEPVPLSRLVDYPMPKPMFEFVENNLV